MNMGWLITILAVTTFFSSPAYAYDPSPLQDICVALNDTSAPGFVNGKFCKDPKLATANDFFLSTSNPPANAVVNTPDFTGIVADVTTVPGLNTLGASVVNATLAPHGVFPLHTHPRATEILTLLDGSPPVLVGFFVPNKNFLTSRLLTKVMNPGDVFVFPIGLIHFQYNLGNKTARFLNFFNSQNGGFVTMPNSIFGSTPRPRVDFLSKNFKLDPVIIQGLLAAFPSDM